MLLARSIVVLSLLSATARADERAERPDSGTPTPTSPFDARVYSRLPSEAPIGPHVDMPTPPTMDPHRTRRHVGMAMIPVGLGLAITSTLLAHRLQDQFAAGTITRDEADSRLYYPTGVYMIGMASVVVGGALWLTSRKPSRAHVGLVPTRGGSVLAASGQF